jgi:UDP-N-acetylglucosamine--N-acetylmuramyl-(pentapeptide) pyrophosphoryl-undecaprenol N-acetylglucosamine transferase
MLLISGGGTGGHVSPGLGVANEWIKRHGEGSVAWVGRPGSIEETMAVKAGLRFLPMTSAALRRGLDARNLLLPAALLKGAWQARQILKAEAPGAVLLTGGYVGLPLGLASATRGVPLVLLEPNAVPGLANRLLKPLAEALCRAYPPQHADAKDKVTGTPCRLERLPRPEEAKRVLGLDPGKKTLLILPGSQAARAINAALRETLPQLKDRAGQWQWIWMTGPAELDACRQAALGSPLAIQCQAFIHDVAHAYAASDLVLCRSGASTLAELAVAGKASLQVPYPFATDGHQKANADAFAASGAARVIVEGELDPKALEAALRELLDQGGAERMAPLALALGKPQAAAAVVDLIQAAALGTVQEA